MTFGVVFYLSPGYHSSQFTVSHSTTSTLIRFIFIHVWMDVSLFLSHSAEASGRCPKFTFCVFGLGIWTRATLYTLSNWPKPLFVHLFVCLLAFLFVFRMSCAPQAGPPPTCFVAEARLESFGCTKVNLDVQTKNKGLWPVWDLSTRGQW